MEQNIAAAIAEKDEATEPWTPASHLDIPVLLKEELVRRELKPRWKRLAELDKARLEGWEPLEVTPEIAKMIKMTIQDGTQHNSYVRKRELILCVMPYTRVKARQKYHEDLSNRGLQTVVDKYEGEIQNTVIGTKLKPYGNIKIEVKNEK